MRINQKVLIVILITTIMFGNLTNARAAEINSTIYTSEAMSDLLQAYKYEEDFLNMLTKPDAISYWLNVDSLKAKESSYELFEMASDFMNESYSRADYAKLLISLVSIQRFTLANKIEQMPSFDEVYDFDSFSDDMLTICGDCLSVYFGGKDSTDIEQITGTLVDVIGDFPSFGNELGEIPKYYCAILDSYKNSSLFLQAIIDNTKNEELKTAAEDLLNIEELTAKQCIRVLSDTFATCSEFSFNEFLKHIFLPAYSELSYSVGAELAGIMYDYLNDLKDIAFGQGKLVFDVIMTFVGDLTFGTTDTYKRENELIALVEIAECISKQCNSIIITNNPTKENYINVINKLDYYSILITLHARGEYITYKMLTNEMNVLVVLEDLHNSFWDWLMGTERALYKDKWYEDQMLALERMEEQIGHLQEKVHFISDNAYITGKVICDDSNKGAYNGVLEFSNSEGNYLLFSKDAGTIKGYIPPGSYHLYVEFQDYNSYEEDIVIEKPDTDLGTIIMSKKVASYRKEPFIEIIDCIRYKDIVQLVNSLHMSETSSWSILDSNNSYLKNRFYIEYMSLDESSSWYFVRNEGNDFVRIYNFKIGDSIDELDKCFKAHKWIDSYQYEGRKAYVTKIDNNYYIAEISFSDGKITNWFLSNLLEGDFYEEQLELDFIDSPYKSESFKKQFLKDVSGIWHNQTIDTGANGYEYDAEFEEDKVVYSSNYDGHTFTDEIVGVTETKTGYLVYLKNNRGRSMYVVEGKSPSNYMHDYGGWRQETYYGTGSLSRYQDNKNNQMNPFVEAQDEDEAESISTEIGFTEEQAQKIIYNYLKDEVADFAGNSFQVDSGYGTRTDKEYTAFFSVGEAAFRYAVVKVNLDTGDGRVEYVNDDIDMIYDAFGVWPETMIPEYSINLYDIQ